VVYDVFERGSVFGLDEHLGLHAGSDAVLAEAGELGGRHRDADGVEGRAGLLVAAGVGADECVSQYGFLNVRLPGLLFEHSDPIYWQDKIQGSVYVYRAIENDCLKRSIARLKSNYRSVAMAATSTITTFSKS
jgi:hypothetical protein